MHDGPPASPVLEARRLASRVHEDQFHSGEPYFFHCCRVAATVAAARSDDAATAAAWLHDALEDTVLTPEAIERCFGARVLALVEACTGRGANRRERNADIARKIAACPDAALIKVADRLDNVDRCWATRDGRLFMYRKEHEAFRERMLAADASLAEVMARLDLLLDWRAR